MLQQTRLGEIFTAQMIEDVMQSRWKNGPDANRFALQAGMQAEAEILTAAAAGV